MVESGNRLTSFDGYQLSYDADGNVTRKYKPSVSEQVFSWNSLGQMATAWHGAHGTAQYGYDALGRRVRRTAPDGSVTRYLYDGDDLLMELDGAGNPIREYTYYPGVDQPHSVRISGGAVYYYATDHPENVVGLIDGTGEVVNEYEYGPWGQVEVVREDVPQPLGYAAREWDAVAGLYQVRARWYDPHTGRFVSEDPIGLAGGINVYRYAANTPINATDPYGLCVVFEKATNDQHKAVKEKKDEYCPIVLDPVSNAGGGSKAGRPFVPGRRTGPGGLPTWPSEPNSEDAGRAGPTGKAPASQPQNLPYLLILPSLVNCPATAASRVPFPLPGKPHWGYVELRRRGDIRDQRSGVFADYQGEFYVDIKFDPQLVHGTAICRVGMIVLLPTSGMVH